MNWIKLIFINLSIFLSLIGVLFLMPPTISLLIKVINKTSSTHKDTILDRKAELKNYNDFNWSKSHFNEIKNLKSKYYDYIIWRRNDIKGKTINISNGLRSTSIPNKIIKNEEVWFFGGSTMWGTGVNDENTIPSIFSLTYNIKSKNFGESSYRSRQSLAMLINSYLFHKDVKNNKIIVFFEGVNEVGGFCEKTSDILGSVRQNQIQQEIKKIKQTYKYSFSRTFSQLQDFFVSLKNRIYSINVQTDNLFICDNDKDRADKVARRIVDIWIQAKAVSNGNGDKFLAILQPVASVGNPVVDYLKFDDHTIERMKQYPIVYPLIKKYAIIAKINFLDLTSAYDFIPSAYIDFAHVSPQGHKKIVPLIYNKISKILNF